MRIIIIGAGRLGRALGLLWKNQHEIVFFDRDEKVAHEAAAELGVTAVAAKEQLPEEAIVVLAVPGPVAAQALNTLAKLERPYAVLSVATALSRKQLDVATEEPLRSLGVKIVGQADHMAQGEHPVIVIDQGPEKLVALAKELFSPVGKTCVGVADVVTEINRIATQAALEAAVHIESTLRHKLDVCDSAVIQSAISQVAAGTLKSYAEGDLGPFARDIVRQLKKHSEGTA